MNDIETILAVCTDAVLAEVLDGLIDAIGCVPSIPLPPAKRVVARSR